MAKYGSAKGVILKGKALLAEIARQKEANRLIRAGISRKDDRISSAFSRALGRKTTGGRRSK